MGDLIAISYETMSVVISICFILIIIIVLIYMVIKEKETARKIMQLENSIEDLNKEIYKIQKWIVESDKKPQDPNPKYNEIMKLIGENRADISSLQQGLQSDREYFEDKILILEERQRGLGHFNTPAQQRNEKQILELFQSGHSIESIAKDLRISKGEVEFVLKLQELNKDN